jgi:competence protein ComEA
MSSLPSPSRLAGLLAACLLALGSLLGTAPALAEPPPGVVNINQASAEQLMLLPRVGAERARRIIEHRQKTPFKTPLELGRVKGIGLKTLRLLKPYIRIDGPTTLAGEVTPEDAESAATRDGDAPQPAGQNRTALPGR